MIVFISVLCNVLFHLFLSFFLSVSEKSGCSIVCDCVAWWLHAGMTCGSAPSLRCIVAMHRHAITAASCYYILRPKPPSCPLFFLTALATFFVRAGTREVNGITCIWWVFNWEHPRGWKKINVGTRQEWIGSRGREEEMRTREGLWCPQKCPLKTGVSA